MIFFIPTKAKKFKNTEKDYYYLNFLKAFKLILTKGNIISNMKKFYLVSNSNYRLLTMKEDA